MAGSDKPAIRTFLHSCFKLVNSHWQQNLLGLCGRGYIDVMKYSLVHETIPECHYQSTTSNFLFVVDTLQEHLICVGHNRRKIQALLHSRIIGT